MNLCWPLAGPQLELAATYLEVSQLLFFPLSSSRATLLKLLFLALLIEFQPSRIPARPALRRCVMQFVLPTRALARPLLEPTRSIGYRTQKSSTPRSALNWPRAHVDLARRNRNRHCLAGFTAHAIHIELAAELWLALRPRQVSRPPLPPLPLPPALELLLLLSSI